MLFFVALALHLRAQVAYRQLRAPGLVSAVFIYLQLWECWAGVKVREQANHKDTQSVCNFKWKMTLPLHKRKRTSVEACHSLGVFLLIFFSSKKNHNKPITMLVKEHVRLQLPNEQSRDNWTFRFMGGFCSQRPEQDVTLNMYSTAPCNSLCHILKRNLGPYESNLCVFPLRGFRLCNHERNRRSEDPDSINGGRECGWIWWVKLKRETANIIKVKCQHAFKIKWSRNR